MAFVLTVGTATVLTNHPQSAVADGGSGNGC